MTTAGADDIRSLYIHIPFCERKCGYCDFVSYRGADDQRAYVDALRAELLHLGTAFPGARLDTVFVGGGTPSFIDPELLATVMDQVHASFALADDAEVTLEANPSSTSVERARRWLAAGFNRVSVGVQALEPHVLRFLERVHDADRALGALADVRAAGFLRVNADLIYAVPGLDDGSWIRTLDRVAASGADHVSCYELTVETGTPLHIEVLQGRVRVVDPDAALRQHWTAVDRLAEAGFAQYEVSNFARPGQSCRHNLGYWRNRWYLAAGVGAHGHVPAAAAERLGLPDHADAVAVRYWHRRSLAAYCDSIAGGGLGIGGSEGIRERDRQVEVILCGLRLAEGLALPEPAIGEAGTLAEAGLLIAVDGRFCATRRGQEVLDDVARRLIARVR